jgi:hypothetical protein
MERPTEPKKEVNVYKEYKFAAAVMSECLAALAQLKQEFPDSSDDKISISTNGYYGPVLTVKVRRPNPNYEQELVLYNVELEKYNSWLEAKKRKDQAKQEKHEKNLIMKAARLEAEKTQQPIDKSIILFSGKTYRITLVEDE